MTLLFILFLHFRTVSIWVRPELQDCEVFVDGGKQYLLSTSTPGNRRFKTKKHRFELMVCTKTDTMRKQIELVEDLSIVTF